MKKLWFLVFLTSLSGCNGCATARSSKAALYQKALADTNLDLTQARDENVRLKEQVKRIATAWYNCKHGKGCTITK